MRGVLSGYRRGNEQRFIWMDEKINRKNRSASNSKNMYYTTFELISASPDSPFPLAWWSGSEHIHQIHNNPQI